MRVAIVGSREYPNPDAVGNFVSRLAGKYPYATVVSGGAKGVDQLAERAAKASRLNVISYRPAHYTDGWGYDTLVTKDLFTKRVENVLVNEWRSFRDAAFGRNEIIVQYANVVVAFWDGKSRGTKNSIDHAVRLGKTLFIYDSLGNLIESRRGDQDFS